MRDASCNANRGLQRIRPATSTIGIYVVPAEEDRIIAHHVDYLAQQSF